MLTHKDFQRWLIDNQAIGQDEDFEDWIDHYTSDLELFLED